MPTDEPTAHQPTRTAEADRADGRKRGDVPGDDQPRIRGRVRLQGADQARRRSQGRVGADPRRRAGRHGGGAGAAPGRLQGEGARVSTTAPAAATGRCAAATAIPSSAARRRNASSTPASTSIPGRGAFPITTTACSITASGWASRSSRSSSSTTMPTCTRPRRSAASRSASARSRPTSRAMSPNCSPRRRSKGQLDEPVSREDREMLLAGAALVGRARQGLRLQDERRSRRTPRLCARSRRRPRRRAGAVRSRSASATSCNRGLWRGLRQLRRLRIPDHHVPAGRRHGPDRRGLRARGRRPDHLQRQGHRRSRRTRSGVTVTYEDTAHRGTTHEASADWCVCTIPLSRS